MNKAIIYNRVSTTEQNPELQIKECLELADSLGLKDYVIIQEKKSAFKDNLEREGFEQIKKAIYNNTLKDLIVWDLDRIYRNRKNLVAFFESCKAFNCRVHSVRQDWLENLNKIPEPFNEIMYNLMLQIMGWIAEEESSKKSERTKNAVRREEGITKSYKGNKWGRKTLSQNTIDEVLRLKQQGFSLRDISKSVFYWDKNNNKRNISVASVHKIISKS
jgi:DNA invertase Pin-like site-specific DNA recombinase